MNHRIRSMLDLSTHCRAAVPFQTLGLADASRTRLTSAPDDGTVAV